MDAKTCIRKLLDGNLPLQDKLETFSEYLRWHGAIGRSVGAGTRLGRELGVKDLFKVAGDDATVRRLKEVLTGLQSHAAQVKAHNQSKAADAAVQLRELPRDTPILVEVDQRQHVVRLIEAKRTRITCEYPDGRRYSIPAEFFRGVHKGEAPPLLTTNDRAMRERIRSLGRGSNTAQWKELVDEGPSMVVPLLDELGAVLERIKNAPVGFTNGLYANVLGPCRKVNPGDSALENRIPKLIGEIAVQHGRESIQQIVNDYPNKAVRDFALKTIERTAK